MNTAPRILITNLLDGGGGPPAKNRAITIQQGMITSIRPAGELSAAEHRLAQDFTPYLMVPPLVDASVFLDRSPSLHALPPGETGLHPAQRRRHLEDLLAHGVLGVGDSSPFQGEETPGRPPAPLFPTIRRSGGILTDNHLLPPAGADFIRIAATPSIDEPDPFGRAMTTATLRHLIAARGEKKVVVIANGDQVIREAVLAGCDAVEQGYGVGRETLELMAQRNVHWLPSLVLAKSNLDAASSGGSVCCRFSLKNLAPGNVSPARQGFWKETLTRQLEAVSLGRTLGIRMAVATGAGRPGILHGESVSQEVKLLLSARYSIAEAIRCASVAGAELLGLDQARELAPGSNATFLLVRASLSQIPRKLAYLAGVFAGGVLLKGNPGMALP